MAESFGVEDRGHFYDPVGALRDVVVNHMLQMVAATAMEPPAGRDPSRCKDAEVAVFRAIQAADPAHYVRGQYDGYLDTPGVAAGSTTETYAALRLDIDNWRWSGVPFYLRTGKHLAATQTEVRLVFNRPPRLGFGIIGSRPLEHGPGRGQARPDDRRADPGRSQARRSTPNPSRSPSTSSSPTRVARAPRPTRCCCTRRWSATQPASPDRTASTSSGGSCSRCSTTRHRSTPTRRVRGDRRRPTSSSPATPAGTVRGSCHERRDTAPPHRRRPRSPGPPAPRRSRRSRTTRFLSDCHTGALVVPGRIGRLAVRPPLRLPEHLRHAARPDRRHVPVRPVRHQRADRPDLRPRHQRPVHELAHADRVDGGGGRAHAGSSHRRGHRHPARPPAVGRRCRPHARAHRAVHQWPRRDRAGVRARLRLRTHCGDLDPRRRRPASRRCHRRRRHGSAGQRHAAGRRARPHAGAPRAERRRVRLVRAELGGRTRGADR